MLVIPFQHRQRSMRGLFSAVGVVLAACVWSMPADAAETVAAVPKVGDTPPAYVGKPLHGDDLNIDPLDGRAYVISFWASWCNPCRQELPILANIQRIAGPDKIKVVAVNIDERDTYRSIEPVITKLGLTSTYDPNNAARKAYGVHGIPHMVIVGRTGKITAIRIGYDKANLDSLADELNRALSAPAAIDSSS